MAVKLSIGLPAKIGILIIEGSPKELLFKNDGMKRGIIRKQADMNSYAPGLPNFVINTEPIRTSRCHTPLLFQIYSHINKSISINST